MLRAEEIVRAVADAAERWRDADFPARVRTTSAIVRRTGYTEPIVDYALDALFGSIDRESLQGTMRSELGCIDALDGFVARPGRPDVYFRPVDGVTIVSSDTTIGVAIPAFVFALCAKARVTVKDRDDALVEAFAATLEQELPALRDLMSVTSWDGTSGDAAQFARAGTVVAYGRAETLAAIRAHLAPEARFIPFGHRTSVGYVARGTLALRATAAECAGGLATDALLFDGEGCLSIHAAFVERGGAIDPSAFAALLADAFDRVAIEFPAAYAHLGAPEAAYVRAARFRAAQGAGHVFGGALAPHAIVLEPERADPPPLLRRILALYEVDGPDEALAFVRRHGLALEAVGGCGAERPDVERFAVATGAARLARLGTLQRPPLAGDHGGVGRILPFVRAIYRA